MPDRPSITRNEAESRFEVEADGELAILEYENEERGVVLAHTWVPPRVQGRGLGERLAQAALDYARETRQPVIPRCSFVRAFIKRHLAYVEVVHPQYRRLVENAGQ